MSLVLDRKSHVNGLWNGVGFSGKPLPPNVIRIARHEPGAAANGATGWQKRFASTAMAIAPKATHITISGFT